MYTYILTYVNRKPTETNYHNSLFNARKKLCVDCVVKVNPQKMKANLIFFNKIAHLRDR